MTAQNLGIIVNGATGGICSFQHIENSLAPIRAEGGLKIGDETIMPRLLLVGRDETRLAEIARHNNLEDWTTDLDAALENPDYLVFFDAAATHMRAGILNRALAAGKHIFAEKPIASTVEEGEALLRDAEARGLKHGVVEDKLNLPGLLKLAGLVEDGFFGRIVGFKLEFGWWVFDGIERPSQRPGWNYRRDAGGGLISDMYPHWRYVIEGLLGPIDRLVCASSTAQATRADEAGGTFQVDVEDNAAALLHMKSGAVGTIMSSWATRVRRDDLFTIQIDGTEGSAVAGLRRCHAQRAGDTPEIKGFRMGAGRDTMDVSVDYFDGWWEVPDVSAYKNPYRTGWENFIAHVRADAPFHAPLSAGIRDVELSQACLRSAANGAWVDMSTPREGNR
ncbi:MAG: Gfo/Idh/MocA family oxidoreductase [Pseudomonadota bacterium]|nr:Gfo/Idh/MocA family oxidoreductase [Pseudomonadota bacterium]